MHYVVCMPPSRIRNPNIYNLSGTLIKISTHLLNSTNTQRKLQLTSSTDITSSGDVDKNPVHSSTTHGKRPHLPIASPLIREFIHEMEGHEELSQKRKMAPSTEDGESGGEKKVAKRICSHEGCTNLAYRRGVCASHGARPKCSGEGCTNYAKKGGLCARHGGKYTPKICGREGCWRIHHDYISSPLLHD